MRLLPSRTTKLAVLMLLLFGLMTGLGGASHQPPGAFHGIAFGKVCVDPTPVGVPYQCRLTVSNFDLGHNPEEILALGDIVTHSSGTIQTGNVLPYLQLIFTPAAPDPDAPFCVGGSGAGTLLSPYVGATKCTLPNLGSTIFTKNFAVYIVTAADYGLPNDRITDQGQLTWRDTCTLDNVGCNSGNQNATAPGSSKVVFQPSITTSVNGNGTTAIEKGQSAFDTVTLHNASPDAGGTVAYGLYSNPTCSTLVADLTPANNTVVNGVAPNSLPHRSTPPATSGSRRPTAATKQHRRAVQERLHQRAAGRRGREHLDHARPRRTRSAIRTRSR